MTTGRLLIVLAAALPLAQTTSLGTLYAPMFDASYHGGRPTGFVVQDTTVAMPALETKPSEWLKQFDAVPLVLRRVATRPLPTKTGRLDRKLLPDGIATVPAATARALAKNLTAENWAAFKRDYKTTGWLAFSEPVLTDDGLDALVYYEAFCGGLCGEGGYAWLHREAARSPWVVKVKIAKWAAAPAPTEFRHLD